MLDQPWWSARFTPDVEWIRDSILAIEAEAENIRAIEAGAERAKAYDRLDPGIRRIVVDIVAAIRPKARE